jgi:phage tail sheath protein FI
MIFVEESIDEGTQWVQFEPNEEATWSLIDRQITIFLGRLWRDGMLVGATEDKAFFVKCDRETMTQDDIDNGRLVCLVGVAPIKPAEFVIIRISRVTAT